MTVWIGDRKEIPGFRMFELEELRVEVYPLAWEHTVEVTRVLLSGNWMVTVAYIKKDDLPELHWLRIVPVGIIGPYHVALTSADIDEAAKDLRPRLRALLAADEHDDIAFLLREPRTGRRRELSDVELAVVAWMYSSAQEKRPTRPWKYLSGETGIDARRLGGWLTAAKRRHLFTKPGRGSAGGELTDKGRQLLSYAGHDVQRDDPVAIFKNTPRAQQETRTSRKAITPTNKSKGGDELSGIGGSTR